MRKQASHLLKNVTTSPSMAIMQAIKTSYLKNPVSPSFSRSLLSSQLTISPNNPLSNKTHQVGTTRAFSTTPNLQGAIVSTETLLVEESLSKISQDIGKAPEIIQSLPLRARKELALALAPKYPKVVADNMKLFEIGDEKTRIDIFRLAFTTTKDDMNHMYLLQKFTNFTITDKESLTKIANIYFRYCHFSQNVSSDLGITDPKIIENAALINAKETPNYWLYFDNFPVSKILKNLSITKQDVIEKILLTLIENTTASSYSLANLAKDLPNLTQDSAFLERVALKIAEKTPEALINTLNSLNLPLETQQKIIMKIIPSAEEGSTLKKIVKKFPELCSPLSNLIVDTVKAIANNNPTSLIGSLKPLNLPEETLQEIIPKITSSATKGSEFEEIVEEVVTLNIKDKNILIDFALAMANKNPEALIGNLTSLKLPNKILEEIIPKMIAAACYESDFGMKNDLRTFIKEFITLDLKNPDFLKTVALAIWDRAPTALIGNLKSLQLPKETLQEIIPKLIDLVKDSEQFVAITRELPTLNLDQSFIVESTLSILEKEPNALAGRLAALHLPRDITQSIVLKMVMKPLWDYTLRHLIKELPKLSIHDDSEFIEKITLIALNQNPYVLLGHLQPLQLKEDTLKTAISKIAKTFASNEDLASLLGIRGEDVYEPLLEELTASNIKDPAFIENTLLTLSRRFPYKLSDDLQNLKFQNKETLHKIIINILNDSIYPENFGNFINKIGSYDIQGSEFIPQLALALLTSPWTKVGNYPDLMQTLIAQDTEKKLPLFVRQIGLEDLTARKDCAKMILKQRPDSFGSSLKLLGLEEKSVFEKIVLDVVTKEKLRSEILSHLVQDSHISHTISPSFFLKRWEFEEQGPLKNQETFLTFLQNPAIHEALNQTPESPFYTHLLSTLARLDKNEVITPQKKLEKLLELCALETDPIPSIAEITGNFILFDLTASSYNEHSYMQRLEALRGLGIENPSFFEKAVIPIAVVYPEYFLSTINKFNISNIKKLETIGLMLLLKDCRLLLDYQEKVKLSKKSLLTIFDSYSKQLYADKKSILPPLVLTEIFSQVLKYRNEALGETYLETLLGNILSINYQKALGYYTIPKKTKNSPPVSIHKILPAIFFAKWDVTMSESNLASRQILSDFLGNSDMRIALRNPVQYPLLQTLLFAAVDSDKDSSTQPEEKLKLFAEICTLQQDPPPSAKEITDTLRTLRFFCSLKRSCILNYDFSKRASEELLTVFKQVAIKNSLVKDLEKIENVEEKYINIFIEEALIPGGLASYEANLRNLPPSPELLFDLSRFVITNLEGTAQKEKYRTDIDNNLLELFENFREVFTKWQESLPLITIKPSQSLKETTPIKEDLSSLSKIEEELNEYKKEDVEIIQTNLSTLTKKNLAPQEQLQILHQMEKDLSLLDPIPADALKALEKTISNITSASLKQNLTIRDIDHSRTLFELPTLTGHSCQNITADPNYNQCLLGYPLDGSVRMIAVQDSAGNFLARSILRIALDEQGNPFLLLEPIYHLPTISHEEATKAIREMAVQKAKYFGIKLFTKDPENKGPVKIIDSKGSSCSMYYSDYTQDASGSHRIRGRVPQKLSTVPLKEIV